MLTNLGSGAIFLKFFALGVIFGMCGIGVKMFCWLFKRNIYITNTAYFCYCSTMGIFFCSLLFRVAGGGFSFYMLIGVGAGMLANKLTLQNLFAKFAKMVYNALTKWLKRLKTAKFGAKVFK